MHSEAYWWFPERQGADPELYGCFESNVNAILPDDRETLIEEGAKSLITLRDRIDAEKMGEPAFLMVLTAVGEYSYPREDGVLVCPISCLGI